VQKIKGEKLKLCFIGALAGVVNGLLGSGGGILLVPFFVQALKYEPKKAFATSVSVTLPLSLCTLAVGYFKNALPPFNSALPYLAGGLLGGILAGALMQKLNSLWLRRIFGALLIIGGVKTLL